MPPRKRYALPETFQRVCLSQIAREVDRTPRQTQKLLDSLAFAGVRTRIRSSKSAEITYDASVIELVKGLINVPHRHVGSGPTWLDDYLGEAHDRHAVRPAEPADPPRPPGP